MHKSKLLAIGAIVTVSLVGTLLATVGTSDAATKSIVGSCSGTPKSSKITGGTVTLWWDAKSRTACAKMTRSDGKAFGTSVTLKYPGGSYTDSDMKSPHYSKYAGAVRVSGITSGGTISASGAIVTKKGAKPNYTSTVSFSIKAGKVTAPSGGGSSGSTAVWDRVAACESSNNWHINTGNGYYGGLQFTASTWAAYGGKAYASRADLATKAQQIAVARKVLKSQGPGAWPACSIKAGLTRNNG
jgi:hypothetical protein